MIKIFNNIIKSYQHISYTWRHYIAFLKVEKRLTGSYKYKFHDWDKIAMYIFLPFLGTTYISRIHQKYQKHHPTYKDKYGYIHYKKTEEVRWEEAVIDWECARLTKKDKPLNARKTLEMYYSTYFSNVEPYLVKLKL